jgi:thiol-disulfide isomerase/thioredoxin
MKALVIFFFMSMATFLYGFGHPVCAQEREILPDLTLKVPENKSHTDYLGLTGAPGSSFEVKSIDTDVLLIELFSMYCPFCQEEAPAVNELYERMQKLSESGKRVKIIGLGAGNSEFEVNHFKNTYDVDFPLFPDTDLSMYNALKGAGTPGFIGAVKDPGEGFVVILRQSGGFYSSEDFLKLLLEKAEKN